MNSSFDHGGTNVARVLFLTPEAFNKVTGAGVTFSNLFDGWPKDSIATIHRDPIPVSTDICRRYYRLTDREIHRWGWLRYISPKINNGDVFLNPQVAEASRWPWLFSILKRAKTLLFGDGIPEQTHITPELRAWIDNYKPTVLYTILGSNAMMELAEKLRVLYRLPLVVHIMDDWVSVIYRGGLLSPLQRSKKERLFRHLMNVSAARFAICDAMANEYQKRYGRQFLSFQNTIDTARWRHLKKNAYIVNSRVRVAYIGSIFPFAQLDSLIDCCKVIQNLHDEGLNISLEIYSPRHLSEKYRTLMVVGDAISLDDTITDDVAFFETLSAVDILVLPVNFDQYTIDFIRYSMPTKIPAYLTVGTPILAYGPSEVAQISYAQDAGWGLTVTVRDLGRLKAAIRELSTNPKMRQRIAERAQTVAAEHHDATIVRAKFQAALNSLSR